MSFSLPFPLLLAEIFLFWWFVSIYGFFPVFAAYIVPSFLGLALLSLQSRSAMANLQRMERGEQPGTRLFGTIATFAAGLLLLAPFFLSRVLGLLLLIPGPRQLLILYAGKWLTDRIAQGGARVFSTGWGPSGFRTETFTRGGFRDVTPDDGRIERDVEVIDVTPLKIEPPKDDGE